MPEISVYISKFADIHSSCALMISLNVWLLLCNPAQYASICYKHLATALACEKNTCARPMLVGAKTCTMSTNASVLSSTRCSAAAKVQYLLVLR